MKLAHMAWPEVERLITEGAAILLPVGSTEQHGPMGMIGTDTICAEAVATRVAEVANAIVAPPVAYTPAPFNTAFAGTVSVSEPLFEALVREIISGFLDQGFAGVYVVNGHGANLAPLARIADTLGPMDVQSWWNPAPVQELRTRLYGSWEGMHATPSEVAITQTLFGALPTKGAEHPPEALSAEYIKAHSGDRHGPPDEHRAAFPDGRVGSHSALATAADGAALLDLATTEISRSFLAFQTRCCAGCKE